MWYPISRSRDIPRPQSSAVELVLVQHAQGQQLAAPSEVSPCWAKASNAKHSRALAEHLNNSAAKATVHAPTKVRSQAAPVRTKRGADSSGRRAHARASEARSLDDRATARPHPGPLAARRSGPQPHSCCLEVASSAGWRAGPCHNCEHELYTKFRPGLSLGQNGDEWAAGLDSFLPSARARFAPTRRERPEAAPKGALPWGTSA